MNLHDIKEIESEIEELKRGIFYLECKDSLSDSDWSSIEYWEKQIKVLEGKLENLKK